MKAILHPLIWIHFILKLSQTSQTVKKITSHKPKQKSNSCESFPLPDVGPTSAEPLPRMTKLWNYCDLHQPAGSSSGSCLVKPGAAQVPSISSSPLFPVPSPLIRSLNALNMSKEKTQTKAV